MHQPVRRKAVKKAFVNYIHLLMVCVPSETSRVVCASLQANVSKPATTTLSDC